MRDFLLDSPYDDRLIDPIIEWVYKSQSINRLFLEDYKHAIKNCNLNVVEFTTVQNQTPSIDVKEKLLAIYGPEREFNFSSIEFTLQKNNETVIIENNDCLKNNYCTSQKSVVINFHKGDQHSAASLLDLLMSIDEGCDCTYYLQYGDLIDSLEIQDTIGSFTKRKKAFLNHELPKINIPEQFYENDINQLHYEGNHSIRTPQQKIAIFQWNLCVYKYINILDSFLMLEPDCVVLKNNWLSDIYKAFEETKLPIFGHLKTGLIANTKVPTHWAGCSVYNCTILRQLPIHQYFSERYDNPWWPFRNIPGTTLANNAFYGPAFSCYDVSFDYFLFALYWKHHSKINIPFEWPLNTLTSREDLIYCDFQSKLTIDDVINKFYEKIPLIHGIKNDTIRKKITTMFIEDKTLNNCKKQIKSFYNKHKNERCVIIGNGPSLNKMDLSFLENEITFGLNRIYLLFNKWKFRPTYYASVNPLVLEQSANEILKINAPKFVSHKGVPFFQNPPKDLMFIKSLSQWIFSTDPCHGLCEGWTVTYFAMQLAYYMGFREVILIGVDHHFTTQGSPNLEVTSTGPDPNHFSADYFGKGTRWHLPDLERSEKSYILAKKAFETENRRILDATVDGKLNIFPKVDYKKYFYTKNQSNHTLLHNDLTRPILEDTSSLLNDAENFIQHGNLIEGIRILKTILIRDEFNIDALNDMAFAFYMDKNYLTALEYIKRAEHINKNDNNTIHNKREILKALSLHK